MAALSGDSNVAFFILPLIQMVSLIISPATKMERVSSPWATLNRKTCLSPLMAGRLNSPGNYLLYFG
jgi:hypothetical protein